MKRQSMQKVESFCWPIIAICAVVILVNSLYRLPLYQMGVQFIIKMQSSQSIVFDWFFLIITMIIDPTIVFVVCVLMMVLHRRKDKGFVMFVFILFNLFLTILMKAIDSDPRPIWTSQDVKNIGFYCPIQYGNPSGHSWFAAVFGFGILLDYKGPGPNYIFIWLSIAAVVLMPLSRMYLGAHSLNQVLEGVLLGLAMCLLYSFKLKQLIRNYLTQFNQSYKWKLVILVCHIIYIIPYFAHSNQQLPAQWQKNIQDKCSLQINQHKLNNLMLLANALTVSLITGIGIGYSQLQNTKLGKHYLSGNWQINQQKYQIKYGYFIFVVIQALCLLSGLIIGILCYLVFHYVIIVYIAINIGGILAGYFYTAKSCVLLEKYKVIREIQN